MEDFKLNTSTIISIHTDITFGNTWIRIRIFALNFYSFRRKDEKRIFQKDHKNEKNS